MLGIGNSKYVPGTVASLVTCLIYIWLYNFQVNISFLILSVFIIFIYSVYSIDSLKFSFSEIDAREIVIDEFIGQSIPVLTIYNFIDTLCYSGFTRPRHRCLLVSQFSAPYTRV